MTESDPQAVSDDLRRGWRDLAAGAAPGPDCPEPEHLMEAAEGSLDPAATREIVDHTSRCASCAEAWRLARELIRESEPTREAAPREMAARGGWSRRYAVAAAAAIVALIALWQIRVDPPGGTVARGGEGGIRSMVEESALPRDAFVLRWSAIEEARYNVEVTTADLEPVARATALEAPEFRVPVDVLGELPSGAEILWQVEVELPSGGALSSPTFVTAIE